jgi:hypothetical protein
MLGTGFGAFLFFLLARVFKREERKDRQVERKDFLSGMHQKKIWRNEV